MSYVERVCVVVFHGTAVFGHIHQRAPQGGERGYCAYKHRRHLFRGLPPCVTFVVFVYNMGAHVNGCWWRWRSEHLDTFWNLYT